MSKPSARQLAYLKQLVLERGQTFTVPTTSKEASEQINALLARPTGSGYWKARRSSRAGTSRTRAKLRT